MIPAKLRPILFLVALVVALAAASYALQDEFGALVETFVEYDAERPVFGTVLFVLLAAGSVMLGPFTSAPLMPFAVGTWGIGAAFVLLMTGWAIGNAAAYGLGFFLGHPFVRYFVSAAKLRDWTRFLGEEIDVRLLFLLRLAAPSEIGYVFGILKYDFLKYLAIVLLAELPFALIVTFGGGAFVDGRWATIIALGGAGIVLMASAFWLFSRTRRKRQGPHGTPGSTRRQEEV